MHADCLPHQVIDEDGLFDILRKTAPQPPESPKPGAEEAEEAEEVEEAAAPPAEAPMPIGVNMGVKREGGALSSTGSAAGAGSRSGAGAGASSSASGSKALGGGPVPTTAPARMPREATGDEAPPLWAEKYRPTAKAHLVGNADQARATR